MGAILHITPDDDPIAGESSSLVFDIQNQNVTNTTYSFTLEISSPHGNKEVIPTSIKGTVVAASYTFPSRGLYILTLRAEPLDISKPTLTFRHSQQISRGGGVAESPPSYPLAEAGLVASVSALLVLGVLFWNNRASMKRTVHK